MLLSAWLVCFNARSCSCGARIVMKPNSINVWPYFLSCLQEREEQKYYRNAVCYFDSFVECRFSTPMRRRHNKTHAHCLFTCIDCSIYIDDVFIHRSRIFCIYVGSNQNVGHPIVNEANKKNMASTQSSVVVHQCIVFVFGLAIEIVQKYARRTYQSAIIHILHCIMSIVSCSPFHSCVYSM